MTTKSMKNALSGTVQIMTAVVIALGLVVTALPATNVAHAAFGPNPSSGFGGKSPSPKPSSGGGGATPTPQGPVCGNGIVEAGEECDGSNLAGASCSDFQYSLGTLACTASCTYETSQCSNDNPSDDNGGGGSGGGGQADLVVYDASITNVATSTATVSWYTNKPATSQVVYGTESQDNSQAAPTYGYASVTTETTGMDSMHSVTLENLESGTTYFVRPVSENGEEKAGDELTFATVSVETDDDAGDESDNGTNDENGDEPDDETANTGGPTDQTPPEDATDDSESGTPTTTPVLTEEVDEAPVVLGFTATTSDESVEEARVEDDSATTTSATTDEDTADANGLPWYVIPGIIVLILLLLLFLFKRRKDEEEETTSSNPPTDPTDTPSV